MRTVAVAFLVMCFVISGLAADSGAKPSGDPGCAAATHAHQYSDLRMAMVEVSEVNQCGFSFANLESNTVGLDNALQYSHDFVLVKVASKDKNTSTLVKTNLTRTSVKKGMHGVAVYCAVCKTVFTLRPYEAQHTAIEAAGQ